MPFLQEARSLDEGMSASERRLQSTMAVQAVIPEEMVEVNSSSTPSRNNAIEAAPTIEVRVSSPSC
jgi:hypothetical protein